MVQLPARQPEQGVVPVHDLQQHAETVRVQIAPADVRQLVQEHVLGVPSAQPAQIAFGHEQDRPEDPEHRGRRQLPDLDDPGNLPQPKTLRAAGQMAVEGLRQRRLRRAVGVPAD